MELQIDDGAPGNLAIVTTAAERALAAVPVHLRSSNSPYFSAPAEMEVHIEDGTSRNEADATTAAGRALAACELSELEERSL
jgi:hypothetical protein